MTSLDSQWSLSTHATSNCDSKGVFTRQWNKPIRILSSWGENVYGYDLKWQDVENSQLQNDWNRYIMDIEEMLKDGHTDQQLVQNLEML